MKKKYIIPTIFSTIIFSGCMSETIDTLNPMNYELPSLFGSDEEIENDKVSIENNSSKELSDKEINVNILSQRVDTLENSLINNDTNNIRFEALEQEIINLKDELVAQENLMTKLPSSNKNDSNTDVDIKRLLQEIHDLKQDVAFLKILNKKNSKNGKNYKQLNKNYNKLVKELNELKKKKQKTPSRLSVVSSDNIQDSPSNTKTEYFIITASKANIRSKPSLRSRILKVAIEDDIFNIKSTKIINNRKWIETEHGYISAKVGEKIDNN